MKPITFKQNDLRRGLPFGILYLVILVVAVVYLEINHDLTGIINGAGSAKFVGLVFGLIALSPFIIGLNMILNKITLSTDDNGIVVQEKKQDKRINYSDIYRMELNVKQPNRLDLYGQNGDLIYFFKPLNLDGDFLEDIIKEVRRRNPFSVEVDTRKLLGGEMETRKFTRKV